MCLLCGWCVCVCLDRSQRAAVMHLLCGDRGEGVGGRGRKEEIAFVTATSRPLFVCCYVPRLFCFHPPPLLRGRLLHAACRVARAPPPHVEGRFVRLVLVLSLKKIKTSACVTVGSVFSVPPSSCFLLHAPPPHVQKHAPFHSSLYDLNIKTYKFWIAT